MDQAAASMPVPAGAPPDGATRAAMVLLVLGEELGGEVLNHLDGEEIKRISAAMVGLGTVPRGVVTEVVSSFVDALDSASFNIGGFEQTERLLRKALPDDVVKSIMKEVSGLSGVDIWRKLPNVDRGLLTAYLKGEHPQTIALILSQTGPEFAARMLKSFERPLASDVITRMLRMQPVQTEALARVEEALRLDFLATAANKRRQDTHAEMAEIFNNFDGRTEQELMAELARANEAAADRVRSLMFTFKDLLDLDKAGIQTLIQASDKEVLARALASADPAIAKLFLDNMSSRSAKRLEDDMANLPKLSRAETEAAQSAILKVTKTLMDKGEIRRTVERQADD